MSMKTSARIPAFSILETVVAMAITAIVSGIIFLIFTIVTERMIDFKNQNQLVGDMNRFTYAVNKDIFEKEKMDYSEDEIVFAGYSGDVVRYRFSQDNILREGRVFTDTFQIPSSRLVIDSVRNASRKRTFVRLAIGVEVNQSRSTLHFYKRIYPNQLLQTFKP